MTTAAQNTAHTATRLIIGLVASVVFTSVFAETYKWDNNGGDNCLTNGANWYVNGSPDDARVRGVPTDSDECEIEANNARPVLNVGDEFSVAKFTFTNGSSTEYPVLDVVGGTFTVGGDLNLGYWGHRGEINVRGGVVDVGTLIVGDFGSHEYNKFNVYGGDITIKNGITIGSLKEACGDILVKGGKVTAQNEVKVGFGNLQGIGGPSADCNSSLVIDGGEFVVTRSMQVASADSYYSGNAGGGGYVSVANGSLDISESLNIAISSNSWGQVDVLPGGTLTVGDTIRVGNNTYAQHAVLNVAGGTVDAGTVSVARQCDGMLYITDGGEVRANQINKDLYAPAAASPKVFIDGGSIVAKNNTGLFFASVDSVTFGNNGATFDTAGNNVTIEACRGIFGVGSFTKSGAGTLEIKADAHNIHCDYNAHGKIVVQGGTLRLPSYQTIYCEGVEIADGAILDYNHSEIVIVTKKLGLSIWTNAMGDVDPLNPANWSVEVRYYTEDGQEVASIHTVQPGIMPTAESDVIIPVGVARPDLSGMTLKSVSLLVSESAYLRGDCAVPDIVREAKCWFDFGEEATVTMDGVSANISAIANKGTASNTVPNATLYGPNGKRAPRYGVDTVNGRKILSLTSLDGTDTEESQGLRTNEIGIKGNDDRTIVVASRRGNVSAHYPLGIETSTGDHTSYGLGHFRIERDSSGTFKYCDKGQSDPNCSLSVGQDPTGWMVSMFYSKKNAENVTLTSRVYSETGGLTTNSVEAIDLNAQTSACLYMGNTYGGPWNPSAGRGQIAEAMYFDRALTEEEQVAIQNYLTAKWVIKSDDMSNIPNNLVIENNATLDFGGGSWTFDRIKGAGTIGMANVTITGTVEPGLTVGGTVAFAEDASFDLSPYDRSEPGCMMVFLTADEIINAPSKAKSQSRVALLSLVENSDGTVSLVGRLAPVGFSINLR